jgi:hypothetical protein
MKAEPTRAPDAKAAAPPARTAAAPEASAPAPLSSLQRSLTGGSALPPTLRQRMETGFGSSFDDVRVHTGGAAAEASAKLQAEAFTSGRDIAFATGQYRPGTPAGDRLIAHELAHVVQQRQAGSGGAVQRHTTISQASDAAEAAADSAAATVLAGGRLRPSAGGLSLRGRIQRRARLGAPAPSPVLTLAPPRPGATAPGAGPVLTPAMTASASQALGSTLSPMQGRSPTTAPAFSLQDDAIRMPVRAARSGPKLEALRAMIGRLAWLPSGPRSDALPVRRDRRNEARADALGDRLRGLAPRAAPGRSVAVGVQALSGPALAAVGAALAQAGQPLPQHVRRDWAARVGADLSGVRVHADAPAAGAARALGADAFAVGEHVVFGAGRYQPQSARGARLLAHELGHVIGARGAAPVIECDDGVEYDEEGRFVITITAPPSVWFTYLDGRYLVRVQADHVAYDLLGWSREATLELYRARRRPDVADPRLPAEQFIEALEGETGLTLLPEARAALIAGGGLPLLPFEDAFYMVPVDDADLARWFGPSQWADYLARPPGTPSRPARRAAAALDSATSAPEAAAIAEPIAPRRRALAGNAALATLYLLLLEHFTGLQITDALQEQARNGLTARELEPILAADARRPVLTDLYTQAWGEYRDAGGSDPMRFEPLVERLLEQYLRGNITARANLLKVGHGIPERRVLGLVHRRSRLLMYDAFGLPMQGLAGIALRDPGFIGYDPPGMAAVREGADDERHEVVLTDRELGDALVRNLFAQALGVDDAVMVEQAAEAIYANLDRVTNEVDRYLSDEIRAALGPTLKFLAFFMIGHATAALLMRSQVTIAVGLALEGLLRAAGYLMGLEFLGQTHEVLVRAAFHMSRVHNDEAGQPTRLSEIHITSAARPLATLITNVGIAMGFAGLGLAVRRIRAGRSRGTITDPTDGLRETATEPGAGVAPDAPAVEAAAAPVVEPAARSATAEAMPAPPEATARTPEVAVPSAPEAAVPITPEPIAPEAAVPIVPEATAAPVPRPLRPGFATRMRARLLGAVMRGVVEAAPITGGTGGGTGGTAPGAPRIGRMSPVSVAPEVGPVVETARPAPEAARAATPAAVEPAAVEPAAVEPATMEPAAALGASSTTATAPTGTLSTSAVPVADATTGAGAAVETAATAATPLSGPRVAPPIAAPTSPATPTALPIAPPVWVNTRSGVFHSPGSRWYGATAEGEYMSEAAARARGYTAAGEVRVAPPTGAYEVERPTRGEPRIVIRAVVGPGAARAGLEREMHSAVEYAAADLAGYERAHSTAPMLGAESGEAIRLAPGDLVNRAMQLRGIESFIRALARIAAEEGVGIHLTTVTTSHSGTLRLASIHYAVDAITPEGRISLFDAAIEVMRDGRARAGVRAAGSDVYTFGPWFTE